MTRVAKKAGADLRSAAPGRKAARVARDDLSFTALLGTRVADPGKRKGQRTRESLKAAAAELLEAAGYHELRVTDINERAGVSNALFYIYFKNKQIIAEEVMNEFLEFLFAPVPPAPRARNLAVSIYRANLEYMRRFVANPGLMRCAMQVGDEIPAFARLWRKFNVRWIERVVETLMGSPEMARKNRDEVWCVAASLGVMVDGVLRILFIDRESAIRDHFRSIGRDEESLARFLTRLWVRALFARDAENPISG